jgi:hypothetical protein
VNEREAEALALLREVEWRGCVRGQGSGMTLAGLSDGPLLPACPVCSGTKPSDHPMPWDRAGHLPDCRLAALLAKGEPT